MNEANGVMRRVYDNIISNNRTSYMSIWLADVLNGEIRRLFVSFIRSFMGNFIKLLGG